MAAIPTPETPGESFKFALVGEYGVGKTCIIWRFVDGVFPENSEEIVSTNPADVKVKTIEVGEQRVCLTISDAGGHERFRVTALNLSYRKADGIFLVYDITNRETFEHLPDKIAEVKQLGPNADDVCLMIVGTKLDLRAEREVPTETAQALAENLHIPFIEVSAKTNEGIEEMFSILAKELLTKRVILPWSSTLINISFREAAKAHQSKNGGHEENTLTHSNPNQSQQCICS